MHIDWREVPGRYIKDPRLGHRLGRNYPAGEVSDPIWDLRWLGTDKDGLVYNESPQRDFELNDQSYLRVFLLGGSTMMGLGVPDNNKTIASYLERYLRKQFPRARTVNCACGAYASWQEMLYLVTELINYKPDVVVVMDGWNDFVHSSWGNKEYAGKWIPNTHRSLDDIVRIIQTGTGDISFFDLLNHKISKWSLVRDLRLKSQYAIQAGAWSDPDYRVWCLKPDAVTYYINNLRTIIGTAKAHGAKIATFFQPQLFWGNRKATAYEKEMIAKLTPRMPPIPGFAPGWYELIKKQFETLHDDLHDGSSIWIEDGASWLDAVTETVYHDYNHYNELGQKLIAEQIGRRIITMYMADESSQYIERDVQIKEHERNH